MHSLIRGSCIAGTIVCLGCVISVTSYRSNVTAEQAKDLATANSRIQLQSSKIAAGPIVDGEPAKYLGADGSEVMANSGDVIVDPNSGATSQAHRERTPLGTWDVVRHSFVKQGSPNLAASTAAAKTQRLKDVLGKK